MADAKREISGFFLSVDKFASHVAAMASPECATTHLRLFHNEPHHTAAVMDALSRNASVTALDIFELDAAAASALAVVLAAPFPRLASLTVHRPHNADAVKNLCRGIADSRSLTRLHLSHLDARGVTALANAVLAWASSDAPAADPPTTSGCGGAQGHAAAPRLQHLRLERCAVTPDAAAVLSAALGGQAGALASLEVVECDLGDAAAEALLAAPGGARLCEAGALGSLDLSSCHVGARGAAQLGRFLAASRSLRSLNLANNKSLGCGGAKALAAGLATNSALRRLDLSCCGVGAAGAEALAAALRPAGNHGGAALPPPPLQHLALADNSAGAAGLVALIRAMSGPRPCALRIVQLDHNQIRCAELMQALGLPTPPPAPRLAAAAAPLMPEQLQQLPRVTAPLEQLALAGNALYDAGVAALAACLAPAPCLEQLDLRENGISDAGVAALLPLIEPRGGGAGAAAAMEVAGAGAGLQGLLLDGNRLHNVGAQALLEAVTAAPGLWRFSAEANKLTDPALRLSLTQLSQQRAARHSQLVVLGRYNSSSSSSEDGGGGGGAGGGGGDSRGGSGGGASGNGHEASSPMDLDGPAAAPPRDPAAGRGGGAGAGRGPPPPHQQQQQQQHHKHRRDDAEGADGEVSSGDERRQALRNVAARGADSSAGADGGGCGGGPDLMHQSRRPAASEGWPCVPRADAGRGPSAGGADVWCGALAIISRDRSSGGGSSMDGGGGSSCCGSGDTPRRRGASSGGGSTAAAGVCGSPPPAMCFVTAVTTGVGGAGSVGVSKRVSSGVGESDHPAPASALARGCAAPQQLLPACRRPRYKPLTPEQQRLFEDF